MKKETTNNQQTLNISYLEYCKLIILAQQIVAENKKEIENKNSSTKLKYYDNELKKKYNLNEIIKDNQEINIILRNNILIPNTNKFFEDYNETGKNIRILAEKYDVSAPVIINKITEIGTYGSYLNRINQEGLPQEKKQEEKFIPKKEQQETQIDLSTKITNLINEELKKQQENLKKLGEENKELVHLNNLLREKIENLTKENKKLKEELKLANTQVNYVKNFMNIAENTISSLEQEEHFKAA